MPTGLEIPSALGSIVAVLCKAAKTGDRLLCAAEEISIAQELMRTITEVADDVRKSRSKSRLPQERQRRIDDWLHRTEALVGAAGKVLAPHEEGSGVMKDVKRSLKWVFRDKNRVVSYQTVLTCLHVTLMGVSQELREVGARSGLEEIYSRQVREQVIGGLVRWENDGDSGDEDAVASYEFSCTFTATAEFRARRRLGYTVESRDAFAAEQFRRFNTKEQRPKIWEERKYRSTDGSHQAYRQEIVKRMGSRSMGGRSITNP